MAETIKPFLCDEIQSELLAQEWEAWLRHVKLFLEDEGIEDVVKKKTKLLRLGGPQLHKVAFNIPGAIVEYDKEKKNDVFEILVEKLNSHFVPTLNSSFERHLFRKIKPQLNESVSAFVIRLRKQMSRCEFGKTEDEAKDINLKDKLIDCWASGDFQRSLLEKELTLKEVIMMCQVQEKTKLQSQTMSSTKEDQTEVVSKVFAERSNKERWSGRTNERGPEKQRGGEEFRYSQASCVRCGHKDHSADSADCPARNVTCNKCGLLGHYARRCKTKSFKRPHEEASQQMANKRRKLGNSKINQVETKEDSSDPDQDARAHDFFKVNTELSLEDPMQDDRIKCSIGGKFVEMLIDSGCHYNLLRDVDFEALLKGEAQILNLRDKSDREFRSYASQEILKVKHMFEAPIKVSNNQEEILSTFYVIVNGPQSLLGKHTATKLGVLKLGLEVNQVQAKQMTAFPKIKGVKVKLSIDHAIDPVQQPPRRIPVAFEERVTNKLNELLDQDIIEPVLSYSPWISPIVVIPKEGNEIRLCLDMRRANQAIKRENFPIPTFESIMTKLRGAVRFSRIDMKNAYHQLELEESSRQITTFITHKGVFRYKRLLFGVNSAPEIFQRIFETILAQCQHCLNYLDDIIVWGKTVEEHDQSLKKVLDTLKSFNVLLNNDKCVFNVTELQFLGHTLSAKGISPDPKKVEAILKFRPPTSKEELHSFLGLVTYLGKFIPNLAMITEPLRILLKKDTKFNWTHEQEQAFEDLKKILANLPMLGYFCAIRRTRVVADASPFALGAVLIQFEDNNQPYVVSFASRSLSEVERRYSQTEKESLAIVWAVERFYYYLAGLEFELVTDHKPLEAIFKPTSKPPLRIERWVLRLQSYKYKIIYQSGKSNIADCLSRMCQQNPGESYDRHCEAAVCAVIECIVPKALTLTEITKLSKEDLTLTEAIKATTNDDWENSKSNQYFPYRAELGSMDSILLRGSKIVIPEQLRQQVLELAHEGHPGEEAMKRKLRSKVWWPQMDRQIEQCVKRCKSCLMVSRPINPAPMSRRVMPNGPWENIAMDLMGEFPSHEWAFVVIDEFSRYMEIKFIKQITSAKLISVLEEMFSRLGIPKKITADNGAQFVSQEFQDFCTRNNIQRETSPPYWPQANGLVENANKSILKRLKIARLNKEDRDKAINQFLLSYNATPHGTTLESPAKLMFNREIRSKIPSIRECSEEMLDLAARDNDLVKKNKGKEREDRSRRAKEPDIEVGDKVLLKNVIFPNKLTPMFGTTEFIVVERSGNEVVVCDNGRLVRRNIAHVKKVPEPDIPELPAITSSQVNKNVPQNPNSIGQQPQQQQQQKQQQQQQATMGVPSTGSDRDNSERPVKIHLKKEEGMWRSMKND